MSEQPAENISTPNPFEGLEIKLRCGLIHHNKTLGVKIPCSRKAVWIGNVHNCKDKHGGIVTLFCQEFLDRCTSDEYPMVCANCHHEYNSFLDRVWDFHRLEAE